MMERAWDTPKLSETHRGSEVGGAKLLLSAENFSENPILSSDPSSDRQACATTNSQFCSHNSFVIKSTFYLYVITHTLVQHFPITLKEPKINGFLKMC